MPERKTSSRFGQDTLPGSVVESGGLTDGCSIGKWLLSIQAQHHGDVHLQTERLFGHQKYRVFETSIFCVHPGLPRVEILSAAVQEDRL
jgi:hypothetical protein